MIIEVIKVILSEPGVIVGIFIGSILVFCMFVACVIEKDASAWRKEDRK